MTVNYHEALTRHLVDLAMIDGVAVGLVEMVLAEDHLLVENVAVTPELHGRGVGRALLQHAESVAARLGRTALRLYKRFVENIRLYKRLGYIVDRAEAYLDETTVYMLKQV